MAEEQGERDWTDMIPRLVDAQREEQVVSPQPPVSDEQIISEREPVEPTNGQGTLPWNALTDTEAEADSVTKPSGYGGVELPQDPVRVQQINKVMWNLKHGVSARTADFYTTGYSWKNIDEFIEMIMAVDVSAVVDIRDAPVSQYKPDFSKDNLRNHLQEHGIAYIHRADFGVPREVRQQAAEAGNRRSIWEWYQGNVIESIGADELLTIANSNGTVAFMCAEIAPGDCHRHLVHLALERAGLRGYDL